MTILKRETFKNSDGPFPSFFRNFRLYWRHNFLNFGFGMFTNLCSFRLLLFAGISGYGSPFADLDAPTKLTLFSFFSIMNLSV